MTERRKSCKIITFHTPINYGAVLQATALYSYVSSINPNTEIIDFQTKELKSKYPLIRKSKTITGLVFTAMDLLFLFRNLIKRNRFKVFLNKNAKFTLKFKTYESIKQYSFDDDYLITGSDQVFRPTRVFEERNVFYLDLQCENATKISYAASFGGVDIPKDQITEIKGYLESFSFLSIREKSGVELLNKLGFHSELVLDPVFLLNEDEWINKARKIKKKKENFILYYGLIDNDIYHKYVECLSNVLKMKVVVIGNLAFKPFKHCEYKRTCGPAEFLSLIKQASYVFTSSFHGVAFSLIFQKVFLSLEEDDILKDRALNLMAELGIPYLSFSDFLELCKRREQNYINYQKVKILLDEKINKSKTFICNALGANDVQR